MQTQRILKFLNIERKVGHYIMHACMYDIPSPLQGFAEIKPHKSEDEFLVVVPIDKCDQMFWFHTNAKLDLEIVENERLIVKAFEMFAVDERLFGD